MNRRRAFLLAWVLALAVPAGFELYGLLAPGEWDMLSEHVIPWVLSHTGVWAATLTAWLGFAGWLTWHWWFQYRGRSRHPRSEDR